MLYKVKKFSFFRKFGCTQILKAKYYVPTPNYFLKKCLKPDESFNRDKLYVNVEERQYKEFKKK